MLLSPLSSQMGQTIIRVDLVKSNNFLGVSVYSRIFSPFRRVGPELLHLSKVNRRWFPLLKARYGCSGDTFLRHSKQGRDSRNLLSHRRTELIRRRLDSAGKYYVHTFPSVFKETSWATIGTLRYLIINRKSMFSRKGPKYTHFI